MGEGCEVGFIAQLINVFHKIGESNKNNYYYFFFFLVEQENSLSNPIPAVTSQLLQLTDSITY